MLHPALHLLATRPQWLADHADAYTELAAAELGEAAGRWRRSLLLGVASLCALAVAVGLAGVALMLWALAPTLPAHAAWLLWATPTVPLLLAAAGLAAQWGSPPAEPFVSLRQQWQLDMALLREMSVS